MNKIDFKVERENDKWVFDGLDDSEVSQVARGRVIDWLDENEPTCGISVSADDAENTIMITDGDQVSEIGLYYSTEANDD